MIRCKTLLQIAVLCIRDNNFNMTNIQVSVSCNCVSLFHALLLTICVFIFSSLVQSAWSSWWTFTSAASKTLWLITMLSGWSGSRQTETSSSLCQAQNFSYGMWLSERNRMNEPINSYCAISMYASKQQAVRLFYTHIWQSAAYLYTCINLSHNHCKVYFIMWMIALYAKWSVR